MTKDKKTKFYEKRLNMNKEIQNDDDIIDNHDIENNNDNEDGKDDIYTDKRMWTNVKELTNKSISLADDSTNDRIHNLELIIAMDNYYKFVYGKKLLDNIYEIPSNLGKIIAGTLPNNSMSDNTVCSSILFISARSPNLDDQLKMFWDLDTVGINKKN